MKSNSKFTRFAQLSARAAGKPTASMLAALTIVVWATLGLFVGFSDTWQLVINTGTTIVTFLMVFLIQNTQNRDTEAIHIKLDELIRAVNGAHNALLDLENLDESELDHIRANYAQLAERARQVLTRGEHDTESPEVEDH